MKKFCILALALMVSASLFTGCTASMTEETTGTSATTAPTTKPTTTPTTAPTTSPTETTGGVNTMDPSGSSNGKNGPRMLGLG